MITFWDPYYKWLPTRKAKRSGLRNFSAKQEALKGANRPTPLACVLRKADRESNHVGGHVGDPQFNETPPLSRQ